MHPYKGSIGVVRAQRGSGIERQAERRDVRPKGIVGPLGILLQVLPKLRDALVLDSPPIIERPSIEGSEIDRRQIVGRAVAAQHVALVHDRPERPGFRIESQAVGVAQAIGIDQPLLRL